jgi:hypothetical protein
MFLRLPRMGETLRRNTFHTQGDASKGRELLVSVVSLYKEMGESKMEQECDILFGQVAQVRLTAHRRPPVLLPPAPVLSPAEGGGWGGSWRGSWTWPLRTSPPRRSDCVRAGEALVCGLRLACASVASKRGGQRILLGSPAV